MTITTDYYAVLGVLATAEDVVIQAAYRALAQRYHPDRFRGSPRFAHERMVELNAAITILSDPRARREYDAARGFGPQSADDALRSDDTDPRPEYDPLENDWAIALRYYPDLALLEAHLAQIAWRLAYAYRVLLLEKKVFEQRVEVAILVEQGFLESYFGKNKEILNLARTLIHEGNRTAARMLNEAVRVLGTNADSQRIIRDVKRNLAKPSEATQTHLMDHYGISFNGTQWVYQSYRYDNFDDALAYATRTHGKPTT